LAEPPGRRDTPPEGQSGREADPTKVPGGALPIMSTQAGRSKLLPGTPEMPIDRRRSADRLSDARARNGPATTANGDGPE
jgi:hypothetical protein